VQLPAAVVFLYWPALHVEHAPPAAPQYPAWHTHAVLDVLPTADDACASQASHAAAPRMALNFPATQAAHGPPFAPVYPDTHWQLATLLLPVAALLVLPGHDSHADGPAISLYNPAAQGAQAVAGPV
jgi:hypothetical protein